jgi:hypothetical protein
MQCDKFPGARSPGPVGQYAAHLPSVAGDDHCSIPVPPTHDDTNPPVTFLPRARKVSRPESQHRFEKPDRVLALAGTQDSFGALGLGGHMTPLLKRRISYLRAVTSPFEEPRTRAQ